MRICIFLHFYLLCSLFLYQNVESFLRNIYLRPITKAALEYKNRTETLWVKRICKLGVNSFLGVCGGGNDLLRVVMSHQNKPCVLHSLPVFILRLCGLSLGVYKREWEPTSFRLSRILNWKWLFTMIIFHPGYSLKSTHIIYRVLLKKKTKVHKKPDDFGSNLTWNSLLREIQIMWLENV